jgi:hypothetical protein
MLFEIPDLPSINTTPPRKSFFADAELETHYQYALLDFVEYIAQNIRDIRNIGFHSFFSHHHYNLFGTNRILSEFRNRINEIFSKTGLMFVLTDGGIIERTTENSTLTDEVVAIIKSVTELETQKLLMEAVQRFKSRDPSERKIAVEKIWDALERIKSHSASRKKDKPASIAKVVTAMSNGEIEFEKMFDAEFMALTTIGNNFRIRHHETYITDITDDRHYDYFFNRCLSLVYTAVQFLEGIPSVIEGEEDSPF